jgi:hypothetical protein
MNCKILDLRFQAVPDEITPCHSSLGGEFGEVDSMLSRTRTSLAPAQPVLCILDNIDPLADHARR